MRRSVLVVPLTVAAALVSPALPQPIADDSRALNDSISTGARRGPDLVDRDSTDRIREYTTEPGFLTEWVDYIPQSDTVPSPRDFLGYVIGTPDTLTQPEKINDYFRTLAETSDRVQVFSMGRSNQGREMIIAAIADAEVLDRLEEIKRANHQLADPRITDPLVARHLASAEPAAIDAAELNNPPDSIPVTYWITAGLHSPETGPPEMVMELAYRLAVSEQPHIREIRRNVLTLISPVLEMDGRARMVDWYYRHLTDLSDYEDRPPSMAPYWGDYTAHDNNRDGLQVSQPLTRNYTDTYHEFLPIVSLDLHESVPLLYASMGTGPYNPTIDPITVTEWLWMSSWDVSEATKLGLRGVWTWGFYTGWYPGYLLWVTNNHNAAGRFYETFGNSHPGTWVRDLENSRYAKKRVNSREWYRPWPPERYVTWSLRNNTNYMQTGVLAALQLAARTRETLLWNFYRKSANSLEKGRTEPPYAFHVPADQRDRGNLHHLLWLLQQHRIEVHRASTTATVGDVDISEGDFLVRMDQPYRNFAKTLLMKQDFPKSAELEPYDDVAWSLDYMLGVKISPVDDQSVQDVAMERVKELPDLPGAVDPPHRWIVRHQGATAMASLRWALADLDVDAISADWNGYPAGSFIIEAADPGRIEELARTFHLDFEGFTGEPAVELLDVDLPRVALFHTWRYTQDSGWARYALEQMEIPYSLINKDDLRAGALNSDYDVIIVPTQGGLDFRDMVQGIDRKWGPLAYTTTPEFPSHGIIDSSQDITGGMGFEGLAHLQRFVEDGGLLITLGSGGLLATESGITRDVSSSPPGGTPGSHVTTRIVRSEHPVAWGFDEVTWVFHGNLPRFTVEDHRAGMVVMQYGTKTLSEVEREAAEKEDIELEEPGDGRGGSQAREGLGFEGGGGSRGDETTSDESKAPPLCLSGIVRDASKLEGLPAILDAPVGEGRVLMYTWNPLHRYQNHHDFPFLTNALLFYNDFPGTPTEQEMRDRERPLGDTGAGSSPGPTTRPGGS